MESVLSYKMAQKGSSDLPSVPSRNVRSIPVSFLQPDLSLSLKFAKPRKEVSLLHSYQKLLAVISNSGDGTEASSSESSAFPSKLTLAWASLASYQDLPLQSQDWQDEELLSKYYLAWIALRMGISEDDIKQILLGVGKTAEEEWRLICTAQSKRCGYFGFVMMNKVADQLVLAHRGTFDLDVVDLAQLNGLMRNDFPPQFNAAVTFALLISTAIKEINLKCLKKLRLSITGHSAGGWLAQMATYCVNCVELDAKRFEFIKTDEGCHAHCLVFDSPGAKSNIAEFDGVIQAREGSNIIIEEELDITGYVCLPNAVNICNVAYGELLKINLFNDEQWGDSYRWNPVNSELGCHSIANFVFAFEKQVKCFKVLKWPIKADSGTQLQRKRCINSVTFGSVGLLGLLSTGFAAIPSADLMAGPFIKNIRKVGSGETELGSWVQSIVRNFYEVDKVPFSDSRIRFSVFNKSELNFLSLPNSCKWFGNGKHFPEFSDLRWLISTGITKIDHVHRFVETEWRSRCISVIRACSFPDTEQFNQVKQFCSDPVVIRKASIVQKSVEYLQQVPNTGVDWNIDLLRSKLKDQMDKTEPPILLVVFEERRHVKLSSDGFDLGRLRVISSLDYEITRGKVAFLDTSQLSQGVFKGLNMMEILIVDCLEETDTIIHNVIELVDEILHLNQKIIYLVKKDMEDCFRRENTNSRPRSIERVYFDVFGNLNNNIGAILEIPVSFRGQEVPLSNLFPGSTDRFGHCRDQIKVYFRTEVGVFMNVLKENRSLKRDWLPPYSFRDIFEVDTTYITIPPGVSCTLEKFDLLVKELLQDSMFVVVCKDVSELLNVFGQRENVIPIPLEMWETHMFTSICRNNSNKFVYKVEFFNAPLRINELQFRLCYYPKLPGSKMYRRSPKLSSPVKDWVKESEILMQTGQIKVIVDDSDNSIIENMFAECLRTNCDITEVVIETDLDKLTAKDVPDSISDEYLLQFLQNLHHPKGDLDALTRLSLKYHLNHNAAGITLFLKGFKGSLFRNILEILVALKGKGVRMIISTQVGEDKLSLIDKLEPIKYLLGKLNTPIEILERHHIKLASSFWSCLVRIIYPKGSPGNEEWRFQAKTKLTERFFDTFKSEKNEKILETLGGYWPLRMFGEVSAEQIVNESVKSVRDIPVFKTYKSKWLDLFLDYVDLKYRQHVHNTLGLRDDVEDPVKLWAQSFEYRLGRLALLSLGYTDISKILLARDTWLLYKDKDISNLYLRGITRADSEGGIEFVHKSFAQFYFAKLIIQESREILSSGDVFTPEYIGMYWHTLVSKCLSDDDESNLLVRRFLDKLLAKEYNSDIIGRIRINNVKLGRETAEHFCFKVDEDLKYFLPFFMYGCSHHTEILVSTISPTINKNN